MISARLREMRRERWAAQAGIEYLPLSQRGIEGDLTGVPYVALQESSLSPFWKRGERLARKFAASFSAWRPAHD